MSTITNVTAVMPSPMTKSGRMASGSTLPDEATTNAPMSGPTMPRTPAPTVSQTIIAVARSRFTRQLPQMVAQLWPLIE